MTILGAAFKYQFLPPSALLFVILLYIAFFASAMGPLVWVVMAEIFPTRMRGSAMAMATVVLWLADFAVTLTFPIIADRMNAGTAFWIYAAMCAVDFVFMLFLVGLMVPFQAVMIPLYFDLRDWGILSTYWAVILPGIGLGLPFGIFLMRAFFIGLPAELGDSAKVDGCDEFQVF